MGRLGGCREGRVHILTAATGMGAGGGGPTMSAKVISLAKVDLWAAEQPRTIAASDRHRTRPRHDLAPSKFTHWETFLTTKAVVDLSTATTSSSSYRAESQRMMRLYPSRALHAVQGSMLK